MRIADLIRGFSPWADIWLRAGWRVQRHSQDGGARVLDPAGREFLASGVLPGSSEPRDSQKFFGSFFQKRTVLLF
jgi:hypothetical protein